MHAPTRQIFLVVILLLLLAAATGLLAQSSAGYDLSWHVISAGGESASASFRAAGSLGQGAAGPPLATSAHYAVSSGYWYGGGLSDGTAVFLPAVLR